MFKGTKIDTFHLQILGVMPRFEGTRRRDSGSGCWEGAGGDAPSKRDHRGDEREPGVCEREADRCDCVRLAIQQGADRGDSADRVHAGGVASPDRPVAAPPAKSVSIGGRRIDRVQVAPGPTGEKDPPGTVTLRPLGGLIQVSGLNTPRRSG